MMQIRYGWKGSAPDDNGQSSWDHLPQETYNNQYRPWADDNAYVGEIHTDVDTVETKTTTSLNGSIITSSEAHFHRCNVCGARSDKDFSS